MAARQPTGELIAFGAELARLRELCGLTRLDLASAVHVTRSYVGQVETGVTKCRRDFAERVEKALDTGTELVEAWDELLEVKGYPRYFADYTKAESSALLIRSFQGFVVDGLLQVEAYARVVVGTDEALNGRMKRQSVLTKDDSPTVCIVLDESVLYRVVGDRVVMREQLEHLISVSTLPTVTLQIAPIAYYRVQGSFAVATQPNGGDVAYLRHLTGGNTTTEPADIVRAETAFANLQARALSPSASRDMIRRVIDERYG